MKQLNAALPKRKATMFSKLIKDLRVNKYIYIMLLPVLLYYVLFKYTPMFGLVIAFKYYYPTMGILGSPWVGFMHFQDFFNSYYFFRLLRNSILINVYEIVFSFPIPIVFALLLNELRSNAYKRTIQTVTYMPHFISLVVVCGMLNDFLSAEGIINKIGALFGGENTTFLRYPQYFRTIYIVSGIWQSFGWNSIIYLAALTNIDPQLYEAATIDGANRFRQLLSVTLPGILPTIIILMIMRMGNILNVGFEKIILLYNTQTYETADVISTFAYRKGLQEMAYSYSTAVGLFNSLVNFTLLICVNKASRKLTETSLW